MRQSAGKNVKKTLAAACSAQRANQRSAAWPWAARIRNPVLLKTTSRNPARNWAPAGRDASSIAAIRRVMQCAGHAPKRLTNRNPRPCAPVQDAQELWWCEKRKRDGSSARNEPASTTATEACAFQRSRALATDMPALLHSASNEIRGSGEPTRREKQPQHPHLARAIF